MSLNKLPIFCAITDCYNAVIEENWKFNFFLSYRQDEEYSYAELNDLELSTQPQQQQVPVEEQQQQNQNEIQIEELQQQEEETLNHGSSAGECSHW